MLLVRFDRFGIGEFRMCTTYLGGDVGTSPTRQNRQKIVRGLYNRYMSLFYGCEIRP